MHTRLHFCIRYFLFANVHFRGFQTTKNQVYIETEGIRVFYAASYAFNLTVLHEKQIQYNVTIKSLSRHAPTGSQPHYLYK